MKHAAWKRREAVLALAILLPCLLLGVYGLILTGRQKNTLELEIKEILGRDLHQITAAIQNNLEGEEKRIFSEMAPPQMGFTDSLSLQKKIGEIMARHPLVSYPFVMNSRGEYLFPPAINKDSLRASPPQKQRPAIPITREFARAESFEYERKDIAGALKLYAAGLATATSPALRAHLLEAVARCYFKLGFYPQAASHYQSLENISHAHPSSTGFYFLALRQQALCHKLGRNREAAYAAYLKLYESLLLTPEKSREIDFFRLEAIDFLQTAVDFSPDAPPQYPRDRYPLESSALNQRLFFDIDLWSDQGGKESPAAGSDRRRFEKIREIYNPNDEETLFYPFLKKHLAQIRIGESRGSVFHLFPSFSGPPFVAACTFTGSSERIITGFCLDIQHIRESLLPRYIPEKLSLSNFQAVLHNVAGNTIFPAQVTHLPPVPGVETALSEHFPGWKLSAVAESDGAVETTAREKLKANYLLLAGFFLSLCFGLFFTMRSAARERRLLREKAIFIQAAAHNLRTPLTKIQLLAEKLQLGWLQDKSKTDEYLQQIISETGGMSEAMGRMLDFARLETGKRGFHFAPFDAAALIAEVLEAFAPSFSHQVVQVETDIRQPLPSVLGDREALASALANLVDNAIKHSPTEKQLKVSAYQEGDRLLLEVADRGPGIAPEERERVFEPFHRGSRPAYPLPPGYGLGLFLVRETVNAHGGRISISGRPGGGTIFRIELPTSHSFPLNWSE